MPCVRSEPLGSTPKLPNPAGPFPGTRKGASFPLSIGMANTSNTSGILSAPKEEIKEEIRRRAYELYKLRGSENGHALDDWLQAELEVRPRNLKFELVIDGVKIVAP